RFVALVRPRGRMARRLGHLVDVNDGRHVLHPYDRRRGDVGLAQRRIVPVVYDVDVVAGLLFRVALEALEHLGDVAFGDLKVVGDGDAVVVVPDGDEHRD